MQEMTECCPPGELSPRLKALHRLSLPRPEKPTVQLRRNNSDAINRPARPLASLFNVPDDENTSCSKQDNETLISGDRVLAENLQECETNAVNTIVSHENSDRTVDEICGILAENIQECDLNVLNISESREESKVIVKNVSDSHIQENAGIISESNKEEFNPIINDNSEIINECEYVNDISPGNARAFDTVDEHRKIDESNSQCEIVDNTCSDKHVLHSSNQRLCNIKLESELAVDKARCETSIANSEDLSQECSTFKLKANVSTCNDTLGAIVEADTAPHSLTIKDNENNDCQSNNLCEPNSKDFSSNRSKDNNSTDRPLKPVLRVNLRHSSPVERSQSGEPSPQSGSPRSGSASPLVRLRKRDRSLSPSPSSQGSVDSDDDDDAGLYMGSLRYSSYFYIGDTQPACPKGGGIDETDEILTIDHEAASPSYSTCVSCSKLDSINPDSDGDIVFAASELSSSPTQNSLPKMCCKCGRFISQTSTCSLDAKDSMEIGNSEQRDSSTEQDSKCDKSPRHLYVKNDKQLKTSDKTSCSSASSPCVSSVSELGSDIDIDEHTRFSTGNSDLDISQDSGMFMSDTGPEDTIKSNLNPSRLRRLHHRTDSISTTISEREFRENAGERTRVVHRQQSTNTYKRQSNNFYDLEETLHLVCEDGEVSFGFHVLGPCPLVVSTVIKNSAAHRAGVQVGHILLTINNITAEDLTPAEAKQLLQKDRHECELGVGLERVVSHSPVCSGYLIKQGGSGLLRTWRRRWCELKPDHCLYYYKAPEHGDVFIRQNLTYKDGLRAEIDPLGAIMLINYAVFPAIEFNRKCAFKLKKYGQQTFVFQAEDEEDMSRWACAIGMAATAACRKKETWLDVSTHNVGLPALSITQPDCHGFLTKLGNRFRTWKRRYCVLKDACLYYYCDLNSSTALGVAHLHGYTVGQGVPYKNKTFGITLLPPETTMRKFYVLAENNTDMLRWFRAFSTSISKWVKTD